MYFFPGFLPLVLPFFLPFLLACNSSISLYLRTNNRRLGRWLFEVVTNSLTINIVVMSSSSSSTLSIFLFFARQFTRVQSHRVQEILLEDLKLIEIPVTLQESILEVSLLPATSDAAFLASTLTSYRYLWPLSLTPSVSPFLPLIFFHPVPLPK